jgi:ribosomal protein S18 acetylase RimI-like enzyme
VTGVWIAIRPADSGDYGAVITQIDRWWGGRQMATMLPRLFFTHFRPWTYVAERRESIVGFLAGFQSQTDPDQAYCHFIGVSPACRGLGVGEALYQRLFADAAARGCREILAVTAPTNRGSIAFHTKLGFTVLDGIRQEAGIPFTPEYDGPGEDRVRLRRSLGDCAPPAMR